LSDTQENIFSLQQLLLYVRVDFDSRTVLQFPI
jgi:hypothetical protein